MEVNWREVRVDVGWGKLAGKTCITGRDSKSNNETALRVVALHGWLDNANTFDPIVPLLPGGLELLVLDLPGHGHSDHMPPGVVHSVLSYTIDLKKAISNYGWQKFILLGHSMGATVSAYFTAMFPEHVIAFINLDLMTPTLKRISVDEWRAEALTLIKSQHYGAKPVYKENEAIERMISAREDVLSGRAAFNKDAAYILLPRSTRQVEDGYIWSHDPKARSKFNTFYSTDRWLAVVSAIKCPVLIILGHNGIVRSKYEVDDIVQAFRDSAAWFELESVEGSHYVHLTHPQRVVPLITKFISKVKNSMTPQSKL